VSAPRPRAGAAPAAVERLDRLLRLHAPTLALLAAWTAMCGSLYWSEVRGLIPCGLCWYQRVLMYPLALLLPLGILRRDPGLHVYVLPFSLLGALVSGYHYLVQKTDLFSHAIACHVGVPCSAIYVHWLGFITIPFQALTAFVIIFLAASAMRGGEWVAGAGPGRRSVAAAVGAVVAAFALLARLAG